MNNIDHRVELWLSNAFDKETRDKVSQLMTTDKTELYESFYTDLDFGTGGMRGIMGVGPNRMNKYTVGAATQGLAIYLHECFPQQTCSVAIAYDSRNNSAYFASVAASVLSANGINVWLSDRLRPTPELSFAVRELSCQAGIVITASHNPKEYNGYKVYWNDGGQLVAPHDRNVIKAVRSVHLPDGIQFERNESLIHALDASFDEKYLNALLSVQMAPEAVKAHADMKIVYTPLHGSGVHMVPLAMERFGFRNVIHVDEQDVVSGEFPTLVSPNPEERSALEMAINKAQQTGAELILATDPDADRVGVGVRNHDGAMVLLNGNQTAAILAWFTLHRLKDRNSMPVSPMMIKTIVTTDLLTDIASHFGVKMYEVLTGFKYIAEIIRLKEGQETFVGGGEESYGYLGSPLVRDKDAVMACCMIAEAAAWAKTQQKSLLDVLGEIYQQFGYYNEGLVSITKKGSEGLAQIAALMEQFRTKPILEINQSKVLIIKDYKKQIELNLESGNRIDIHLPASDVLQFICEDGSKITVRPSGTEPKIKFYFSVRSIVYDQNSLMDSERKLSALKAFFQQQAGLASS